MKTAALLLKILTIALFIGACDKDDDDTSENWAAAVAGTYTGTATFGPFTHNTSVLITRIGDKQLNLQYSFDGDSFCLDSVMMNSATTFAIGEYDGCYSVQTSGAGNFNGNTVTLNTNVYTGISITATK